MLATFNLFEDRDESDIKYPIRGSLIPIAQGKFSKTLIQVTKSCLFLALLILLTRRFLKLIPCWYKCDTFLKYLDILFQGVHLYGD